MSRVYPHFLTPGRALRLLIDVCAFSVETWALDVNWSRIGKRACIGALIFAAAYFIIRGFVSLKWGV